MVQQCHADGVRRDAEANQQRLLDAAVTAVRRNGEGVPMATVAAEAGVGVGTLYRHFASREELLDGVSRHAFQMVLRTATHADRADRSGAGCLDHFLTETIAHADRLVLPLHGGPLQLSADTRAVRRQVHHRLQAVVERGIADGSVRADLTAWDVIAFGALVATTLPNSVDWPRTARRLAAIWVDGLRPVPVDPASR